jgi:glycosyltransferase involved in cell wall biosynthesis
LLNSLPTRRLAWVFPGFGVGGAQMRFCALANHFGSAVAHSVISLNGDLACAEKLLPGLDVQFPQAHHPAGRLVEAVLHARGTFAATRPDLVITSNWGAIEWAMGARLAGMPHLHSEDGFGPEEQAGQIARRVWTRRLALRGSQLVLPSRNLLRIARDIWRLPERRLHYVPNGIDLARFAKATPMDLPPGEGPVLGTIAALRAEKNIGRLVRAVAEVRARRPVRLVVVGDGPERAGLQLLARALDLEDGVLFPGHSQQPERWMASFDAFALSSDTEQMPLSLLEAMAAGLPCLCTDVGDVRSMVAEANVPFIVPPQDAPFADGLAAILLENGRAIGAANQAKAREVFGQEPMFLAWAKLLGVRDAAPTGQ